MTKSIALIALIASALPMSAFAHGTKLEQVSKSTVTVLDQLTKEDNDAILDGFTGIKTWIDGDKIQVKVYLAAPAAALLYTCIDHHMPDGTPMTMCSKAQ
jgi:hypothetical protein